MVVKSSLRLLTFRMCRRLLFVEFELLLQLLPDLLEIIREFSF
jgi:hypothetical protein